MSNVIELHDSCVEVSVEDHAVVLRLRPAYVHHWEMLSTGWRGEGRSQSADVVIARGSVSTHPGEGVFEVSDGWFEVGGRLLDNLIPVPFEQVAGVRGHLDLANAEPLDLRGERLSVRLVGDPRYVEDLPAEWAPE